MLPDGGGIEQAFWYQLFIVDLLGLVEALLEHRRHRVPRALADAVRRGRRFLRALADGPDDALVIGRYWFNEGSTAVRIGPYGLSMTGLRLLFENTSSGDRLWVTPHGGLGLLVGAVAVPGPYEFRGIELRRGYVLQLGPSNPPRIVFEPGQVYNIGKFEFTRDEDENQVWVEWLPAFAEVEMLFEDQHPTSAWKAFPWVDAPLFSPQ